MRSLRDMANLYQQAPEVSIVSDTCMILRSGLRFARAVHGTYCRRKKPTPFVMNRYCEFVTSVGLNNPPFQFPHAPPRSGLN